MFENIVSAAPALARHRNGPLVAERDRYLRHCAGQGATLKTLRLRARSILWVAKQMSPDDFGQVEASRLHEIVYGSGSDLQAASMPAPSTAATLVNCARPWLKYLDWWHAPLEPIPFEFALDRFVTWMRDERGLTECTIIQWRYRTAKFLVWCGATGRDLAKLQPQDIDTYFVTYGAQRWSRTSAGQIANMLRVFLRHAATTGELGQHHPRRLVQHVRLGLAHRRAQQVERGSKALRRQLASLERERLLEARGVALRDRQHRQLERPALALLYDCSGDEVLKRFALGLLEIGLALGRHLHRGQAVGALAKLADQLRTHRGGPGAREVREREPLREGR